MRHPDRTLDARASSSVETPGRRLTAVLLALLAVGFVVSVVHYVDNVVNYADYPQPDAGTLPAPSAGLIAFAWFFFTAFGAAGLLLYLRRRPAAAAVCLAVYAGSGLVGFAHYAVTGALDMVWWRHLHVVADIVIGIAVLGVALWLATRRRVHAH